MDYTQIKVNVDERVGVITLSHNPPRNSFTKRMLVEVLNALDEFEENDTVRCVMMNSEGPNFSMGADFDDIDEEWNGEGEIKETFSELGGKLVARVDFYPKPTLVAARGICFGGSAAVGGYRRAVSTDKNNLIPYTAACAIAPAARTLLFCAKTAVRSRYVHKKIRCVH